MNVVKTIGALFIAFVKPSSSMSKRWVSIRAWRAEDFGQSSSFKKEHQVVCKIVWEALKNNFSVWHSHGNDDFPFLASCFGSALHASEYLRFPVYYGLPFNWPSLPTSVQAHSRGMQTYSASNESRKTSWSKTIEPNVGSSFSLGSSKFQQNSFSEHCMVMQSCLNMVTVISSKLVLVPELHLYVTAFWIDRPPIGI